MSAKPLWTVAEVARALGLSEQFPDTAIGFVTQDSRLVKPGSLFIALSGTPSGGLAASRPGQSLVVSPSLEFVGSNRLSGNDSGERETSISSGLHFWWPKSGWQVRAGVAIPISGVREADRTFLLQVGNHLNWGKILR